jgi:hypothetical protein
MTRINVSIPVEKLSKAHLIAEHREIKRIPNCIKSGRYNMKNQPSKFTLGTGHVKFFYDKLEYLRKRYIRLYNEGLSRGINFTYYGDAWNDLPVELCNDYKPTKHDYLILRERLIQKDINYKAIL